MADDQPTLDEIRQELIALVQSSDWRMTEVAERTGRTYLGRFMQNPTQLSIVNQVLERLHRRDCELIPVPMGIPEGSRGIAFRIRDPQSPELYIKVKIEEELAWILSFKLSDHQKGL